MYVLRTVGGVSLVFRRAISDQHGEFCSHAHARGARETHERTKGESGIIHLRSSREFAPAKLDDSSVKCWPASRAADRGERSFSLSGVWQSAKVPKNSQKGGEEWNGRR